MEKMREKKNPKRNSESALPDGNGTGTVAAEPPKKTRKSADSSLSPVTQNRKREGQTTSAPSIEPQPPVRRLEHFDNLNFTHKFFDCFSIDFKTFATSGKQRHSAVDLRRSSYRCVLQEEQETHFSRFAGRIARKGPGRKSFNKKNERISKIRNLRTRI